MRELSETEKDELARLIRVGEPLPERWRDRLFPNSRWAQETGKEYRLVYDGKLTREEVLAQAPAAPWQLVREFCTKRPHTDGWRNLLTARHGPDIWSGISGYFPSRLRDLFPVPNVPSHTDESHALQEAHFSE